MSRYHSYLNSAHAILDSYQGNETFASFLRKYFTNHKKYGSRDRKTIAHLCYCYFRTGGLFNAEPREEKLLKGLFLCSAGPTDMLEKLRPEWNQRSSLPLAGKFSFLAVQEPVEKIFPWTNELSEGIRAEGLTDSFLMQPALFLRIRPGHTTGVLQQLKENAIVFSQVNETCLALPNTTRLEGILALNKEVVIQDLNSQRIGEFLNAKPATGNQVPTVWDCCAASGGKSILAVDTLGEIDLTVSDVRERILFNLRKRFSEAGITNYRSFLADLAAPGFHLPTSNLPKGQAGFELIIADVPCTGSGTWSRTPEQLYFFDEKKIGQYADLQKRILSSVVDLLAPGGFLLYITCSVFKRENEEAADFLEKKFHLRRTKMESLTGYDKKADTMFACLLEKPL